MPATRIRLASGADAPLAEGLAQIARELKLPPAFAPEVEAAAAQAARAPRLPALDRTDVPLVTIDPPGSLDLDQALHIERRGDGHRVYYAIADVAAFVTAGDAIDLAAHRRGETLYGAESRIPLHPASLSEGAASLLPGQVRPALLWTIDLDGAGEMAAVDVRRAQVRSRARLDYAGVQQTLDAGTADPVWRLLREVGERRAQREAARGGISLALPEQEIALVDGHCQLRYRVNHPVEDWNAQISLLTGMAAAQLMLTACTTVLRGAGYVAFDGTPPEQPEQAALAAPYAHATAPLRRLVDRYVGEVCVALCAGSTVPTWARAGLAELPALMGGADRRAHQYERAVIDLIEAVLLAPQAGAAFAGAIVELGDAAHHRAAPAAHSGVVMLHAPAIEARVTAAQPLPLGQEVRVRLVEADPLQRSVRFAWPAEEGSPAGTSPEVTSPTGS
ncbi:MAG: RNB domain-containing ribonuclease [Rhodanobacter sp.]|nr:MAG: RNB domain-containing ribonuclease [Rhodanobacter sp.]TAM13203.1 MAG: RNB domain-containing ribonuclease [Rhodanobacter sp.]TAM35377.1 MAG: RNB domain-containing ribonuclease [Rhodanobacter sp.]